MGHHQPKQKHWQAKRMHAVIAGAYSMMYPIRDRDEAEDVEQ